MNDFIFPLMAALQLNHSELVYAGYFAKLNEDGDDVESLSGSPCAV